MPIYLRPGVGFEALVVRSLRKWKKQCQLQRLFAKKEPGILTRQETRTSFDVQIEESSRKIDSVCEVRVSQTHWWSADGVTFFKSELLNNIPVGG